MNYLLHHLADRPIRLPLVLMIAAMASASTHDAFAGVIDLDGDGYSPPQDCCDSSADGCAMPARVNPAAIDAPGNAVDDNCNGTVDEPAPVCTENYALHDVDTLHASAVLGICHMPADTRDWGLVASSFQRADGTSLNQFQIGVQNMFGTVLPPYAGTQMLALSTGSARTPGQPNYCASHSCTTGAGSGVAPPGFPQAVVGCPVSPGIGDDASLVVTLRAPRNAVGFRIHYDFYAFDWNEWVCTQYNDQFIVRMTPAPAGSINGNIAFDERQRPVGVNSSEMVVCNPAEIGTYAQACTGPTCPSPPTPYCPFGAAQLTGTGFDGTDGEIGGATGWREASAPVTPGQEFTLQMLIYDVANSTFDSTVLLDGFEWILSPSGTDVIFEDGFE